MDAKLLDAARQGESEEIKLLLEEGAGVNVKNENGWTPLHWATRNGHADAARVLLDKGAHMNAKNNCGSTPLHLASHLGRVEVAYVLLDRGADLNTKNDSGKTPLDVADNENTEMALRMHKALGSTQQKLENVIKQQNEQQKVDMVLETVGQIAVLQEMHSKRMEEINKLKSEVASFVQRNEMQQSEISALQNKIDKINQLEETAKKYEQEVKQYKSEIAALEAKMVEYEQLEQKRVLLEDQRKDLDKQLLSEMNALQARVASFEQQEESFKKKVAKVGEAFHGLAI
jgi:DNA repair exonuclease SbcCD ATPase subunit